MEIQHGKGPWANPVSGIVPLGTTLTMVIGINDKQGEPRTGDPVPYGSGLPCMP